MFYSYSLYFISFFVLHLNAGPVRRPRGLDLSLGIGSVLGDNNQIKNDGSASNTHSTVIKGPLGLGTLTISHTHGSAGGTNQPDPSVSNNGLRITDPSVPTTLNATQPDCAASPVPVSGLNINLHFGRPPPGPPNSFGLPPPPPPPPYGHNCEAGYGGYPPPPPPHNYNPPPPNSYHPSTPPPPNSYRPPNPLANSGNNQRPVMSTNRPPISITNQPPILSTNQPTTLSTTASVDDLIGEVFGNPNNAASGQGSTTGNNNNIGGGNGQGSGINGGNNGIGDGGNVNPSNSGTGESGLDAGLAGPPEETGDGLIDIRGMFGNSTTTVKPKPIRH